MEVVEMSFVVVAVNPFPDYSEFFSILFGRK
jgi:hypothetical protein